MGGLVTGPDTEATVNAAAPQVRSFSQEEIHDIDVLMRSLTETAEQTPGFWIQSAPLEIVDAEHMEPVGTIYISTDKHEQVDVRFIPHMTY